MATPEQNQTTHTISLRIGDRHLSFEVSSTEEEALLRRAAKKVNEQWRHIVAEHKVSPHDAMAYTALLLALESLSPHTSAPEQQTTESLREKLMAFLTERNLLP